MLFDKQFGFQLNNSTEHAILQLQFVMSADDTNLFLSNKDIKKLFNDMNVTLQKTSIWFKDPGPQK